ncbi:MAG TPA: AAA family ATPase [Erysipelotrichaceae bacterium]|nr:AAA family ATPase [Erysipelotrichaceae bacterium]
MKKKNVLNLIRYHSEKNDLQFNNEAMEIARYFDRIGDYQLSEYIMALITNTNTFVPQNESFEGSFFKRVELNNNPLPLPKSIANDVLGIINAINHKVGVNKFLFQGAPGTGKTETVKHIARLLERQLYMIEFSALVDSKLGQTAKNMTSMFDEINKLPNPQNIVILFDELDAIAMDRININDLREMGRVTSTLLKELDKLNEDIVLIATTNLYDKFDKALIRRFDSVIDFNRYSREDLIEISESIFHSLVKKFKNVSRETRLLKKIINQMETIPYPGDLNNLIKTSLAFSDPNDEYDYLRRLIKNISPKSNELSPKNLSEKGFTVREIEILSGISKSKVARELKG